MLEFIMGRAGTGKTYRCLEDMRKKMEQAPLGTALVLLLPEHMTYQAERDLAASMGTGQGFFRAYVFGFRRFARQILMETGGMSKPHMTEVGRRLLLRRVLQQHGEQLSAFARAARQRGFSASLSDMLQELKSYRVEPEQLSDVAEKISDAYLAGKLSDLALLERGFASAFEGRQLMDAGDLLNVLTEKIPQAEFLEGAEVYVDGFTFFNPQEKAILEAVLQKVEHVHVTFCMEPSKHAPENHRETGVFYRAYESFVWLWQLAGRMQIGRRITELAGAHRLSLPALQEVEQQLFSFPPRPVEAGEGVHIVEAANRRMEVEAIAADILRLCREKDYRFHDIGILVREHGAYDGLLPLVLEDHGIPFFVDRKRAAAHHPLAELLRSALELLHGWRYEAVFRCLRTGFFPMTWEQIDLLENYVLEFGIRGEKRWRMEEDWPWFRHSIEEEANELSEAQQEHLAAVNLVRRGALKYLSAFADGMKQAKSVRGITTVLYGLLESLQVPSQLADWAEAADTKGNLAMGREHAQIWDDIMELFEQLVAISGDEEMELRVYEQLLGDGLDALEMSLIPPGLDYVTVADFDQNSLSNTRAIYILGANEGSMPRRGREQGLLTDADRLHLHSMGLEIAGGGKDALFAEKYLLYHGFTQAREYLWISYALADAEGKGLAPSSLVERIRSILPHAEFLFIPLASLETEEKAEKAQLSRLASLRLSDSRRVLTGIASALRGQKEKGSMAPWWQDAYNWLLRQENEQERRKLAISGLFARAPEGSLPEELALRLFTKGGRLRGSVTRFERFKSCPFQHFAQYGLKLKERQEYRFQALDLGNLLHSTLREFGELLKADGRRWSEVGEVEWKAMVQEILARLAPRLQNEILLSTAQYRHQLERIRILAERSIRRLIAFDAASRFHPQVFERSFGRGVGAMPPLSYELGKARLEIVGQIDRMDFDEDGKYFLIMDYKTGQAYINLVEVYYGLKMQLLTYLLVARNLLSGTGAGEVLPAGMLYCFLRYPTYRAEQRISPEEARKKIESGLKMPGWVLADPEVIEAIDSKQQFIKVKLNKDRSISQTNRASVRSLEEFDILMQYIDYLLEDTGRRILSGDIAARPYRMADGTQACQYCAYQLLCGFEPELPGYACREIKKLGDEEIMDGMAIKQQPDEMPGKEKNLVN